MNIRLLITIFICLSVSGCVIWPFGYERSETPRVIGKVVDIKTGLPIQGVALSLESTWEIKNEAVPTSYSKSDHQGQFVLEKAHRPRESRVFFLMGDIFSKCSAILNISKNGYNSASITVSGPAKSGHFSSVCDKTDDITVYIELESLKI
ncbi:MAG: hypothetical protein RPR91_02290 [Colwellia sp.]